MTLYGRTALFNTIDTRVDTEHASAQPGGITADQTRNLLKDSFADIIDSFDPKAGAAEGGRSAQIDIALTSTPQKIAVLDADSTSENEIYLPDHVNDRIRVKRSCFQTVTVRGKLFFATNVVLTLELRANGVTHPILGERTIRVEGAGAADPRNVSNAGIAYPIFTSMLSGGFCDLEIWASVDTPATVGFQDVSFSALYTALTADEI